jgi:A/G-specific adenine glycosylase
MLANSSPTPAQLRSAHQVVYHWYAREGRTTLPWRQTSDPYAIYLSEIMLQQTQVATVLDRYYFQFLAKFPTLQALADAPIDDVLKAWEGLGYYRRARNLHKAAQTAAPTLPTTIDGLMALSGVGKNTAHAVATFAYKQPVAILEANVKRIMFRLFALEAANDKHLWEKAHTVLDTAHPYEWNQALMDIGSSICTPKNPRCEACPLAILCEGKTSPERFPSPKQRTTTPTRHRHLVILWHPASKAIFTQARTSEFLGGLYGFIELEDEALPKQITSHALDTSAATEIGTLKQVYSHFTLYAKTWVLPLSDVPLLNNDSSNGVWINYHDIPTLALSRADSKAYQLFLQYLASEPMLS